MSSNPLMMSNKGGDFTADWRCLWPVVGPLQSLCMQAVGDGLSSLETLISDQSALEVCTQNDALYTLMPLPFLPLT